MRQGRGSKGTEAVFRVYCMPKFLIMNGCVQASIGLCDCQLCTVWVVCLRYSLRDMYVTNVHKTGVSTEEEAVDLGVTHGACLDACRLELARVALLPCLWCCVF